MSDAAPTSWNEGNAKEAIVDFVKRATTDGPDFVVPADRIATFHMGGATPSPQFEGSDPVPHAAASLIVGVSITIQ